MSRSVSDGAARLGLKVVIRPFVILAPLVALATLVLLVGGRRRGLPAGEAARLLAGGALLLDVRTVSEFSAEHAPGAVNVPLHALPTRLGELPTDQRLLVICATGPRSLAAAGILRAAGCPAEHIRGGMAAWSGTSRRAHS